MHNTRILSLIAQISHVIKRKTPNRLKSVQRSTNPEFDIEIVNIHNI